MNHTSHQNLSNAHNATYKALQSLSSSERLRIIESVLALLGEETRVMAPVATSSSSLGDARKTSTPVKRAAPGSASAFFEEKAPKSKAEEYVVAAAYLKKTTGKARYSKDDLARVVAEAGRSFNRDKFKRDFESARAAGFLTRDTKTNLLTLLPRGQQFVEQLPERPALIQAPKRKTASSKKPTKKQQRTTNARQVKPTPSKGKPVSRKKPARTVTSAVSSAPTAGL